MLRILCALAFIFSTQIHAVKAPSGYVDSLRLRYQKTLTELGETGIGTALELEQRDLPGDKKIITDEEKMRIKFPAIYWTYEDEQKPDSDPGKYVQLNENEVTQIPKGFNNIVQNVVEKNFGKNIEVSDQEAAEWQKQNPTQAMKYVQTSESYQRTLKDVTDAPTYVRAQKIYQEAKKDIQKIKEASIDMDTTQRLLGDYLVVSTDLENHSKMEQLSRGLSSERKRVGEQADSHGIK